MYKQTTGALAVFAADLLAAIYKRATGVPAKSTADPSSARAVIATSLPSACRATYYHNYK
ncbi:hypothetical protein DJ71_18380 [Halorubrum sp. E3]|nr:hypothetical protein DJ71_18380 [Halorubrum sp. E3]